MIKLEGNEIWRAGEKIGYLEGKSIHRHDGQKLGFFEENVVYEEEGHKIAYLEGDFLFGDDFSKISLEKIAQEVTGGVVPEIVRAAIYILFERYGD